MLKNCKEENGNDKKEISQGRTPELHRFIQKFRNSNEKILYIYVLSIEVNLLFINHDTENQIHFQTRNILI